MTPFVLKNQLSKVILLLMVSVQMQLYAQPDTVVVYEHLHVTDTIWVDPEIDKIVVKPETCTESKLSDIRTQLEFSSLGKNEDKEEGSLSFSDDLTNANIDNQNRFFGKPIVGIYFGYTRFWYKPNPYGASTLTSANHIGVDMNFPHYNNQWSISAGILSIGNSYLRNIALSSNYTSADSLDDRIERSLSIPLLLHYNVGKWQFFGGLEFKNVILDSDIGFLFHKYQWFECGFAFGIEYLISPQLSISTKIYSSDFLYNNQRLDTNLYSGTSNSVSLKLYLVRKQSIIQ